MKEKALKFQYEIGIHLSFQIRYISCDVNQNLLIYKSNKMLNYLGSFLTLYHFTV